MDNNNIEDKEYQNLKDSKFKQQKLPAWRPVPTVMSTFVTFTLFGTIFIVLGVIILIFSNQIEEYSTRYDETCKGMAECEIEIDITASMSDPVIVYYQLDNFYQNHRRYVKSKSNDQLKGEIVSKDTLESECEPAVTNEEMGKTLAADGTTALKPEDAANPCGLIAKSFFNDTFELFKGTEKIEIDEKEIAWSSDIDLKYKRPTEGEPNTYQWIDNTDEHFIVWMRPAGLPNFRKLWGRVRAELAVGKYKFKIKNNYDVSKFEGKKHLIISTVNAFGGKNNFLGISYITVGSLCIVIAILFLFGYKNNNSKKLA